MPLLDHFHPPSSEQRHWESFHAVWIGSIADDLTRTLPVGYFVEEQVHAGSSIEINVGTFEAHPARHDPGANGSGAVGVATPSVTWVPTAPAATVPAVFADDFEVRVISTRGGGPTLVAAVELVSPGNKDRDDTRRAFATKCASYLSQSVAVVIVDVVTTRLANLHRDILSLVGSPDAAPLPPEARLYAAAYRPIRRGARAEVDCWSAPLAIGAPLPTQPLWLTAVTAVRVDLESTYADACRRRRIAG
ncbi:MAG: hypothetical protein JWO38_6448 [Gemmataceae bacterium]|nr:hypothetical protein [Gemmataceae bacterium]